MKEMLKKYLSLTLALLMLVSVAYTTGGAYAAPLADGAYDAQVAMKDANNISSDSMAAGALANDALLEVENGQWFLTVEFKTVVLFGAAGNASQIKYYENGLGSQLKDAEVISTRQDQNGNTQVAKVKMPVAVDAQGIYINMYVDAMQKTTNAYIALTVNGLVAPTHYSITASAEEHGTISPIGVTSVTAGAIKIYTITADSGYRVKDITVDGQSKGAANSYKFDNVQANHTIVASFEVDNTQSKPDGSYTVYSKMMLADDITKPSMAAGALVKEAVLDVVNGEWFLTVEFKTLVLGQATGDATNIKYYQGMPGSALNDAEIISYRKDAQGAQQVEKVKIPVAVGAEGVYVNMEVKVAGAPAHGTDDAYIAFSFDDPQPKPDGSYTVYSKMMLADDITKPSMAAGALVKEAVLDVINGEWFLTVEFKTLVLGQATGDATNIKYYQAMPGSALNDAEIISYRKDAQGAQQVEKVKIPVAVGAEGVYVNMEVKVAGAPAHGTDDAYIAFSFEKDAYTITASADAHGSITPVGTQTVAKGNDQVYTIKADQGYQVESVIVDNVNVGKKTSYTFKNVMADHTIRATFEKEDNGNVVSDSFGVYTEIRKAYNTSEESMAAGAIDDRGLIEVIDGKWYLTVEFQSINFMGQTGSAEDIKYYTNGLGSTLLDAEVLSYRTDDNGDKQVKEVKIPVDVDGKGVYINMYVEAMQKETNAYIAFSKRSFDSSDDDNDSTTPAAEKANKTDLTKKEEVTNTNSPEMSTPLYQDVSPLHSYFGAVQRLSQRGLLKGTGNGQFTPYAVVNRATLTTLLYRIAGKPAVAETASFDDVPADQWFTAAVAWAKQANIVNGYSKSVFGPQDVLTKEQIMTIVYRYNKSFNKTAVDLTVLNKYADNATIAPYAKEAIAWAYANGILTLDDFGRINPKESVTRANMAVILDKILEWQESNR